MRTAHSPSTPKRVSHFPIEVWGITDKGRVRESNEDTVFPHSDTNTYAYQPKADLLIQKGQLLLVADGVGGAQAGSEASRWVRRVVVERYYDSPDPNPASALHAVIFQANAALYQYLQATGVREAGSTVVAAVIHQNVLYVAHVGDSRAYLFRNGQAYHLTQDHTLTQLKLLRGLITPEQAATDPDQGVLTRSLGAGPTVDVDLAQPVPLAPGDVVLLCSDGLTDVVRDDEIAEVVRRHPDPRKAARELLKLANRRGGPDNITVAIARVGGKGAVVPQVPPRRAVARQPALAGKGFLASLTPAQKAGILVALALLVVLVFAALGAAILLTREDTGGGGAPATATPTAMVTLSATPAPGTPAPTVEAGAGTDRPTSTPLPTSTPTPTGRPPRATPTFTPTPTPTPTPTAIPGTSVPGGPSQPEQPVPPTPPLPSPTKPPPPTPPTLPPPTEPPPTEPPPPEPSPTPGG